MGGHGEFWRAVFPLRGASKTCDKIYDSTPVLFDASKTFENDLIPEWLSQGRSMKVFPNRGNFIDIGTPESFTLFQQQGKIWC